MRLVIRLTLYLLLYALMWGLNLGWQRWRGKRSLILTYFLYVAGLMLSVALVEEFHR